MPEMIAGARSYVDVAPPPVLGGGVLAVANVVDVGDPHQLMGAQYETDACAEAQEWVEWCTNSPLAEKILDADPDLVVGDPFAVYAGVECDFQVTAEARIRAERRLAYAEGRQVDQHVIALLDATLIDLGGPYPIEFGIGVMEGYAASVYGGVPTLLIPRLFVPCACDGAIHTNLDGSLATCQGAKVANVSGTVEATGPGDAPVTGNAYVTGQITLLRSEVLSLSVPQQPLAGGLVAPPRALAERLYVPLIECVAAKVEVTCS